MAKKVKRSPKPKASAPAPGPIVVINPFGPTRPRPIKRSKVVASSFTLSDGTKLQITPMVSDVRRAVDQYNQKGEPLYFLTFGHQIKTIAPKRLWKKMPKARKKKK